MTLDVIQLEILRDFNSLQYAKQSSKLVTLETSQFEISNDSNRLQP